MNLEKLNIISFEEKIYDDCDNCLVAFSRKDCHVCQEVIPMVEQISDHFKDNFKFYSVDIDEEKDLYNRFSLRGVPTIMFFKDGEYQRKLAGLIEETQLEEIIDEML